MSDIKVGDKVRVVDASGMPVRLHELIVGKVMQVQWVSEAGKMAGLAGLRNAGTVYLMTHCLRKVTKSPEFGPVPVDEWTYNPTTFAGLADHEVARVIMPNPDTRPIVTYVIRDGKGFVWMYNQEHKEWDWSTVSDVGWLTNPGVTFVTATEYPEFPYDKERGDAINEAE